MARQIERIGRKARCPARPYRKRQVRRKTVLAFYALLALFVAVSAVLVIRLSNYRAARDEYADYQAMEAVAVPSAEAAEPEQAVTPTEIVAPAFTASPTARPFESYRVSSLKKENRDTVGWLDIPDADIQYPVVQCADNEYYMTHTFKKKRNASGAIFLDCGNTSDFTDFNTVIYGHNMKDGSMFAGLREYRHQKFFDEHPYIEVTLLNKKLKYRVFAAYVAKDGTTIDFRGQDCATEAQRSAFIKAARKRSTDIASSYTVSRYDRLLTLVTCAGGDQPWFWVVHAVLVEEET